MSLTTIASVTAFIALALAAFLFMRIVKRAEKAAATIALSDHRANENEHTAKVVKRMEEAGEKSRDTSNDLDAGKF